MPSCLLTSSFEQPSVTADPDVVVVVVVSVVVVVVLVISRITLIDMVVLMVVVVMTLVDTEVCVERDSITAGRVEVVLMVVVTVFVGTVPPMIVVVV